MYDAIVVGARCAVRHRTAAGAQGLQGSAARSRHFPSDMPFSNHYVHQAGSAALKRWGLLDKLAATNCPPITTNHWDYGAFALTGSPVPSDGVTTAYAPRRLKLDPVLVDGAVAAGVELREGFSVQELVFDQDRVTGIRGHQKTARR